MQIGLLVWIFDYASFVTAFVGFVNKINTKLINFPIEPFK